MTDQIPSKPEMKAGTPDLFSIDTMTAIRMGTRNLKKYMYEIQEEGKKLGLVVKVEKTDGGLLLWWYPEEMEAELGNAAEEAASFDKNEYKYIREVMPAEELKSTAHLGDVGPWEWDISNNKPAPTFIDDILQHMSVVPEGEMEAEKKLLLESADVTTMSELWSFFKTAGEVLKLDIRMVYSGSGEMVQLYWKPIPDAPLADDQTAPPT